MNKRYLLSGTLLIVLVVFGAYLLVESGRSSQTIQQAIDKSDRIAETDILYTTNLNNEAIVFCNDHGKLATLYLKNSWFGWKVNNQANESPSLTDSPTDKTITFHASRSRTLIFGIISSDKDVRVLVNKVPAAVLPIFLRPADPARRKRSFGISSRMSRSRMRQIWTIK